MHAVILTNFSTCSFPLLPSSSSYASPPHPLPLPLPLLLPIPLPYSIEGWGTSTRILTAFDRASSDLLLSRVAIVCTVLHSTVLYCKWLHCTVLYCTTNDCTAQYFIALPNFITLHSVAQYCTVLISIVLHSDTTFSVGRCFTVLHFTVLYSTYL